MTRKQKQSLRFAAFDDILSFISFSFTISDSQIHVSSFFNSRKRTFDIVINLTIFSSTTSSSIERAWAEKKKKVINREYLEKIRKSSTFLINLNWNRMFWKIERNYVNVQVLRVTKHNDERNVATIAMLKRIKWTNLKNFSDEYKSWNVKISFNDDDREFFEKKLKEFEKLNEKWNDFSADFILLSFSIVRVRIVQKQLELLKDYENSDVDRLQKLINENIYSFEYDDVACVNSDSSCEIDRFQKNVKVMMKFTIHFVDLVKSKKFDYFLRMQSLYLMNDDAADLMKISRKRRKTNEWLISSLKTKVSRVLINSLTFKIWISIRWNDFSFSSYICQRHLFYMT